MRPLYHILLAVTIWSLITIAQPAIGATYVLLDDPVTTCQPAENPQGAFSPLPSLPAAQINEANASESELPEQPVHSAARIAEAIATYRAIADAGGWPSVQPGALLRMGDVSPRVRALRERLTITGDLSTTHEAPRVDQGRGLDEDLRFDADLDRAVRHFQWRHGLQTDGIIGSQTIQALNVSAEDRAAELEESARRQEITEDWESTHIYVNLPAFEMRLIEDGTPVMHQRAIIGTPRTPTPEFTTHVTHAVLAPYWNVPESIARRTIYPRAMEDPGYLARHGFVQMESGRLRQNPGPTNFLGRIKFHIPNDMAIGLHDTPDRHLFSRHQRAYSSGCIRLEEPLKLAEYLLQGTDWTMDRMHATIDQNAERWIILPNPISLHIVYWTAWVDTDHTVHFRDDLYGRLAN